MALRQTDNIPGILPSIVNWVAAKPTNVSSDHTMPLALFASVYEKPSTWPVLRPKRPCRLGPILLPSLASRL